MVLTVEASARTGLAADGVGELAPRAPPLDFVGVPWKVKGVSGREMRGE